MNKLLLLSLYMFTMHAQDEYTRHTLARDTFNDAKIVYYFSKPKQDSYPIIVLIEGSYCDDQPIASILRLHTEFKEILTKCHAGILTIEKWGVDGENINELEFHAHNTISQRVDDHKKIINNLNDFDENGWDGRLIFIGGSEGCDVITSLLFNYLEQTAAIVLFSGIGLYSKKDEIWNHMQSKLKENPSSEEWDGLPIHREEFDQQVLHMIKNPESTKWWYGQTYRYWADAFTRKKESISSEFYNVQIPIFISMGSIDYFIESCDALIKKMQKHNMKITYHKLPNIAHEVRIHAPHIFDVAANWLQESLQI